MGMRDTARLNSVAVTLFVNVIGVLCFNRFALAGNLGPGVEIQTAHYDLYTEAPNPQETGVILEQFHDKLKEFFGTEPTQRLRVEQYANLDAYRQALSATRENPAITFEGIYMPSNKTAYIHVAPAPWTTRHRLLHECVHQFEYLSSKSGKVSSSSMYREGLAEYFAGTTWDGKTLKVGVWDGTNDDFAGIAAEIVAERPDRTLRKAICDDQIATEDLMNIDNTNVLNYGEARAVTTFLATEYPEKFHQWSVSLESGEDIATAWDKAFAFTGFSVDGLDKTYRDWLYSHYQPITSVTGYWDRLDQAVDAITDEGAFGWAIIRPHRFQQDASGKRIWNQVRELTAQITCKTSETDAGLAVAMLPGQNCILVLRTADNIVEVRKTEGVGMSTLVRRIQLDGKRRPDQWTMSTTYRDGQWHVYVDNHEVQAVPGTENSFCGLALKGNAEFRTDLGVK